jgi:hypothetical protein
MATLTTDPKDPTLKAGQKNETGQHSIYLVLSEEERAKGFVRPVRNSYIHIGLKPNYAGIDRMLSEKEQKEMMCKFPTKEPYVAIMCINDSEGKHLGGSYVTRKELDAWENGGRIGGCGTVTTMSRELAETYARNPKFYGATFCCGCNKHIRVDEFMWVDTNELVGS